MSHSIKLEEIQTKIQNILMQVLCITEEEIQTKESFLEMGMDSILASEITQKINIEFQVKLLSMSIYDYPTVLTLSQYINSQLDSTQQ
jgi:acyl carrier protein